MTDLEFGLLVKKTRALKNATLKDLSQATDLSMVCICKVEKGKPSLLRTKIKIAQALGLGNKVIDELAR